MVTCKICNKKRRNMEFKVKYLRHNWFLFRCSHCAGKAHVKALTKEKRADMFYLYGLVFCTKCGKFKLKNMFSVSATGMFGFKSYCKKCYVRTTPPKNNNSRVKEILYKKYKIKICTLCKEQKPITEFYKFEKGLFGLNAACKRCVAIRYKNVSPDYIIQKETRDIHIKYGEAWCSSHKKFLPITEFHKDKKGKFGLKPICKECTKEVKKTYRLKKRSANGVIQPEQMP